MDPQQRPLSDFFRGNHRRSGVGISQSQLSSDGLSPVPEDFHISLSNKGKSPPPLPPCSIGKPASFSRPSFRPYEVQFCREEGRHLVWVFKVKSSWPHVPGSICLVLARAPALSCSQWVSRLGCYFVVWQPHSLPRRQGLNQGSSSSLDSFPLSHNNSAPTPPTPFIPSIRKARLVRSTQDLDPGAGSGSFLLEMLSSHVATSPLQSKDEKTRSRRLVGADLCPSDLLGLLVTGKARTELWEEEGDGTVWEDSSGSEGVLPTSAPLPLYARNRKKPGSGSLFQFGLSPGEALPGQGRVFSGAGEWGGTFSHPEQEACWHVLVPGSFRRKT